MGRHSKSIPDFTGTLVCNDRFKCVEKIGSGSFGVVYRAIDEEAPTSNTPTTPQYAIKILTKADLRTGITPQGFHVPELQAREIKNHQTASSHPNVVTLHETFCDDYFIYMVLELCQTDLFTVLSSQQLYWRNDAKIKRVFLQILDAVQFMHSKAVFHRDLKPDNILCSTDGETMYVSDFGLSTNSYCSTNTGCGSAVYMSPESLAHDSNKDPYSPRHADIWALGIILINILVSCQPWEIANRRDAAFCEYMTDDPGMFLEMFPISRAANHLLCRMLKLDPLSRIGIGALKMAIEDIDTFFMTNEELNGPFGTSSNRKIARGFDVKLHAHNSLHPPEKQIASIILPGEEIDITSTNRISTGIYDSYRNIFSSSSSYLEDSFTQQLDYFKPSTPREALITRPARHNADLALLRYMLANAPVKLNIEEMLRADKLNLAVETPEEAKQAQRSGLPVSSYDKCMPAEMNEFVIGSLSSDSESSSSSGGPVTPPTQPMDPDEQVDDLLPLPNPYSSYEDQEIDLGAVKVPMKERSDSFDIRQIMDSRSTWDNPLYVVQPSRTDSQAQAIKRTWIVRDFRDLPSLN